MFKKVKNLKESLLVLSFVPIVTLFILAFFNMFLGYCGESENLCAYGLNGFYLTFADVFASFKNIFLILIYVAAFVYQCIYLLYFSEVEEKGKRLTFLLVFIPFIYIILNGIIHLFVGIDTGIMIITKVYGLSAMIVTMSLDIMHLSFIPILPACLIYMVIFLRYYYKNRKLGR